MDHLKRLGNAISISFPPDENRFTGRECPEESCKGYFKIECGTGLKGTDLPCHCPYCGRTAEHDKFYTEAQIEYAKSVALNRIFDAFRRDLKALEFDHRPKGSFGIGISLKVTPSLPIPIHRYKEKALETEVICGLCTLRYAIYGVFAFCPDCGQHNSLQILEKNLLLVGKMLGLSETVDCDVREKLIENALEDCISAFDGFGRNVCQSTKKEGIDNKIVKISFQNIDGARTTLINTFRFDIANQVSAAEWQFAVRCFQKRHLFAHKMGVVDSEYLAKTDDRAAIVGRKVSLGADEVKTLLATIQKLAEGLTRLLDLPQQ